MVVLGSVATLSTVLERQGPMDSVGLHDRPEIDKFHDICGKTINNMYAEKDLNLLETKLNVRYSKPILKISLSS